MRLPVITLFIILVATPLFAAEPPTTEEQKTLYAVGLIMARQLSVFNLTPAEFEIVMQGVTDGISERKPLVDINAYRKKTQELAIARRDAGKEKRAEKAKEFIERAAGEKGAVRTRSGLVFLSLKEGSGAGPKATDTVKVNYRGTLIDGQEFDSSYRRGQAAEFVLNSVMACWTEGLQMMKPGGKARLVCPPELAYGKIGSGPVPANSPLVFEVELLSVKK